MVGDSVWDCEAAKRAGVETVAVLTGGFSEQELRDAGAVAVFASMTELRERLDRDAAGRRRCGGRRTPALRERVPTHRIHVFDLCLDMCEKGRTRGSEAAEAASSEPVFEP